MNRNAPGGFSVESAAMSMAVHNQVSAMTIHNFGQARISQKRVNLRRFSRYRGSNRRIVQDHDSFLRSELRHGTFQFYRLRDRSLHESFDLGLSECGQNAAAK